MLKILFLYSLRNLLTRYTTTLLTALGMALVVFVFSSLLMLSEGLQKTLVETGSTDNVVVIRKGSTTEVQSGIDRDQAALIETQPEIAFGSQGRRMTAKEVVVLITLPKRGSNIVSNVVLRGISKSSLTLRPQVRLMAGRLPRRGSLEIISGQSIAERFQGVVAGESLTFANRRWQIVGIFDAGKTGFASEIWGDVDQFMQAFRRPVYSSVLFKLRDPADFNAVRTRLESDPRLTVDTKREMAYYQEQSKAMAKFLKILGVSLTLIFSIGAVIGALITMYASVANRIAEIGTLRALGFQKTSILAAFLAEALFLGLIGAVVGLIPASLLQLVDISTTNFQTFSELAFSFHLTADIIWKSLVFSLTMGFAGGLLPALRAARMNIINALRAG